ncbi:hypothetical protein ACFQHO_36410 [Actinomadura yumaensis]|uniref:hypothetical protein n=1 Tax=Actinomadura yumaensis TaxID=111807 RepID=UPI00360D841A
MADSEHAGVEDAWTPVPGAAVGWLSELDPDHCYSGFEPPRRPDAAWILHAMYAWKEGLVTTTHDDVHQSVRAAGLTEPDVTADADLGDLLEGAVVTGTGLGRSGHPGAGWRRLRWAELARGSASRRCRRASCPATAACGRRTRRGAGRRPSRRPPRAASTGRAGSG